MNAFTTVAQASSGLNGGPRDGVRAGRVVSTAGAQIIVLLEGETCPLDGVQMGSLVTVRSPHGTVYGIIEGLSTPMPMPPGEAELKMAEIGLLGEMTDDVTGGHGGFRRGVTRLPSLDASVYLAGQVKLLTMVSHA